MLGNLGKWKLWVRGHAGEPAEMEIGVRGHVGEPEVANLRLGRATHLAVYQG